jgi:hypothetical protein
MMDERTQWIVLWFVASVIGAAVILAFAFRYSCNTVTGQSSYGTTGISLSIPQTVCFDRWTGNVKY